MKKVLVPLIILAGAAGLALAGWLGFQVLANGDLGQAAGRLPKAVEEAKEAGVPWESKDVLELGAALPEVNAAPELKKATALLKKDASEKINAGFAQNADGREPVLKEIKEALNMTVAASSKPRLDWKRDWDYGHLTEFPEFATIKTLVKGLALRGQTRLEVGRILDGTKDLQAANRLAGLTGQESSLIALLVQIALQSITNRAAQVGAAAIQDKPRDLAALRQGLVDSYSVASLASALRTEAYMTLPICRNWEMMTQGKGLKAFEFTEELGEPAPKIDPSKLVRTGTPKEALPKAYLARHLEFWTPIFKKAKEPGMSNDELSQFLDAEAKKVVVDKSKSGEMIRSLAPVFSEVGSALRKTEADRRVTLAYLSVLQFRAMTKRWPTSLKEAGVDGLIDPFDGKPMRFIVEGAGFRVYSIGQDLKDDKGDRMQMKDVSAIFPPPPATKT